MSSARERLRKTSWRAKRYIALAAPVAALTVVALLVWVFRGMVAARRLSEQRLGEVVARGAAEAVAEGVAEGVDAARTAMKGITFRGNPLTPELLSEVARIADGAQRVSDLRVKIERRYGPGSYDDFVDAYTRFVGQLVRETEAGNTLSQEKKELFQEAYRKLLLGKRLRRAERAVIADFLDMAKTPREPP